MDSLVQPLHDLQKILSLRRENKMTSKVLVTIPLFEEPLQRLKTHYEVTVNPKAEGFSAPELLEAVQGMDGVLCCSLDSITPEVIDAATQAKVFANYGVGYNNIDVSYATQKGIFVANTPDVLNQATADLAWALMLSVARKAVPADHFTRAKQFEGFRPRLFLGLDIYQKTLGVIGAGRIGGFVAKRALGFDMEVLYHNRTRNHDLEQATNAKWVELETLLKTSDFISINVPLNSNTKYMIQEEQLRQMKPSAILINTARGPIVDEKALVKALKEGWIYGAGLDVYEQEPLIEPELLTMDNVVLLPHIGSSTLETRVKMTEMAASNILKVLEGGTPLNWVNPECRAR